MARTRDEAFGGRVADRRRRRASALPNFFIIGAARSGTTSLYHYLDQHPDVYMPPHKEPHWFSRVQPGQAVRSNPVGSEEEYLRLFSRRTTETAAGEASPSYLWDEKAPRRIKEAVPEARIIAILRDPMERAHSHYLMTARRGDEDLPFLEALERSYHAKRKIWGAGSLYVDLGFYAEQLQRYLDVFDEKQIKVFLFEELNKDPKALFRSTLEFLEVDSDYADSVQTDVQYNGYSVPKNRLARSVFRSCLFRSSPSRALKAQLVPNRQLRSCLRETMLFRDQLKPRIGAEAKELLTELYRPDVQRLQRMLGRDLGAWLGG